MKSRKVNAKALERAVNYVRQARANAISKDRIAHAEVTRDCGVSNTYATQLSRSGHITKSGWEQKNLKDFDIAMGLITGRKQHQKAPVKRAAKAEEQNVVKTERKKYSPKKEVVKKEQSGMVLRVFGLKVFEKMYF